MEYVQEGVATLHDYEGADPSAPVDSAAVVVPMTDRDHASPAANHVLSTLERVGPGRVVVALRADPSQVPDVVSWLKRFDLPTTVLWCNAPQVEALLAEVGLDGPAGKGRDVWLALGVASEAEYVVVHDVDATTYDERLVPRMLFPLAHGYEFSKGYYARVENQRLYGRLFRLFFTPLVRALADEIATGGDQLATGGDQPGGDRLTTGRDGPAADAAHTPGSGRDLLSYLQSFRYALAGEVGMTADLAQQVRAPRGWGFEVGTLGEAFRLAGVDGSAQVDLGVHEHDHRPVTGSEGLARMCPEVAETLFTVLEAHGVEPDYRTLPARYRTAATELVEQYAIDAAFNGFDYDRREEHRQVDAYVGSIEPPGPDDRLPAWCETSLSPESLLNCSERAIERLQATVAD